MDHPVSHVTWVPINLVRPNRYNPNSQHSANHELLCESIREDGFTQPIVVRPPTSVGEHVIIDGEHRFLAAQTLGLERVPIVVLDRDVAGCMAATVRHNRARGHHGVVEMGALVREMLDEGFSRDEVRRALGLGPLELKRLIASEEKFLLVAAGKDAL